MKHTKSFGVYLVVIPVIAFILMMGVTSKHKMGVAADSIRYLSIARHIAAGKGVKIYNRFTGGVSKPVLLFQPLYPAILAIPTVFNIEFETSTWVLMNFILGVNLFLAGCAVYLFSRSILAGFLIQVMFLFERNWMTYHSYVLTEPLFYTFTQMAAISLWIYFDRRRLKWLVLACFCIVLTTFVRYVGIAYIPALALCLFFWEPGKRSVRLFKSLWLAALTSLPIASWFIRHYVLTGELFDRGAGGVNDLTKFYPFEMLLNAPNQFAHYPVWNYWMPNYPLFIWFFPIAVLAAAACAYRAHRQEPGRTELILPLVLLIFGFVYGSGVSAMWTIRSVGELPDPIRFLSPVFNHLWCFAVIFLILMTEKLKSIFKDPRHTQWSLRIGGLCVLIWLGLLGHRFKVWAIEGYETGSYQRMSTEGWEFVNKIQWFPEPPYR